MKSVSFNKLQEGYREPVKKEYFVPTYDIQSEMVLEGNTYKTIIKTVKRTENPNKGQKASDYRLDNILAVGATDLLVGTPKLSGNSLDSIDNISAAGNSLADSLNSLNTENNG